MKITRAIPLRYESGFSPAHPLTIHLEFQAAIRLSRLNTLSVPTLFPHFHHYCYSRCKVYQTLLKSAYHHIHSTNWPQYSATVTGKAPEFRTHFYWKPQILSIMVLTLIAHWN